MEIIGELLFQLVGELLLSILGESIAEVGLESLVRSLKIYFVVSPIAAGFALCLVSWIINHGINPQRFFQVSKFIYGVVFALTFAVTRAFFG